MELNFYMKTEENVFVIIETIVGVMSDLYEQEQKEYLPYCWTITKLLNIMDW